MEAHWGSCLTMDAMQSRRGSVAGSWRRKHHVGMQKKPALIILLMLRFSNLDHGHVHRFHGSNGANLSLLHYHANGQHRTVSTRSLASICEQMF
jgi:hypothetical protein